MSRRGLPAAAFFETSRGFRETLTVHPVGCQCAAWCAPVAEPVCERTGDHAADCCCMECDDVTDAREAIESEPLCECCSEFRGECLCIVREIDGELGCLSHRARV